MKNLKITLLLLVISLSSLSQNLNFEYAKKISATDYNQALDIVIDDKGNSYTTGAFRGTADFDPSVNVFNLTSNGFTDCYILKLDSNGNFIWAISFGGSKLDSPRGIVVDENGNIYCTGEFYETVDFDPSPNISNLNGANSKSNGFVLKLDSNGNHIWSVKIGSGSRVLPKDIGINDNNGVLVVGGFDGYIDGNGDSLGVIPIYSEGQKDIFVLSIDTLGAFTHFDHYGGTGDEYATSIATPNDNIGGLAGNYITCVFDSNINLHNGHNHISNGGTDLLIIGFYWNIQQGSYIYFSKSIGGIGIENSFHVTNDNENISAPYSGFYVTGRFTDSVNFNPYGQSQINVSNGGLDIFIQKYSYEGNHLWTKTFGSTYHEISRDITSDNDGNVFVVGDFANQIDFDPGINILNITSQSSLSDCYIQMLDKDGNWKMTKTFGGPSQEVGFGITVKGKSLYTCGQFHNVADFDVNQTTFTLSAPFNSSFIQKNNLAYVYVGINEMDKKTNNLYPNPTTNYLFSDEQINSYSIFDMKGSLLFRKNENSNRINLNHFNKGSYLIQTNDNEPSIIIKK